MPTTDLLLEARFRAIEESHLRVEVRSSPEAMRMVLAEDFTEFGSSGKVYDREMMIEALRDDSPFEWAIEDFTARLLGPGVVLTTYRLSVWWEVPPEPSKSLRSSVWVERGGRWMLLFHQGTKVAIEQSTTAWALYRPAPDAEAGLA